MEFCGNCGAQVPEGANVCPGCGAGIGQAQAPAYQAPDAVVVDEAQDANDNKLMGILGYLFFFVPLITGDAKKSPFVKFWTNQGMILWALSIAYSVVSSVLRFIFGLIFRSGGIYGIISMLLGLLYLAVAVFAVIGLISVVQGKKKELPIIGNFDLIKLIIK